MILTHQELNRPGEIPAVQDRAIAARVASFFCALFALWFWGTPILFFGVSEETSRWNYWIVGSIMLMICATRMVWPLRTSSASLVNAVLGAWVIISPWVFGYSGSTLRVANSLAIGAIILTLSLLSRWDITVRDPELDTEVDTSAHR